MEDVRTLAASFGSTVHLVQVVSSDLTPLFPYANPSEFENQLRNDADEYLRSIQTQLREQGVAVERAVRSGDVAEEILNYAAEHSVDLIAMSTHGRSGVEHWLLGSIAEKVIHHATIPVLLVRSTFSTEESGAST
jgi:nucleotide-binding universal stress UspA family protein